ncbi:MAG: peptide chain release factor N(5)-glutamine methyltransferase [Gammaproteobacteria bacterium]|nr:peptide chain release factor N(5)-glutamine methyltransferase [Gammaproteobacteria bacterium]
MVPSTPSVSECLQEATRRLPYHEALKVTEKALDLEPGTLGTYDNVLVGECDYSRFVKSLDRRCSGEPIAYIFDTQAFRTLDLYVSPDVLIPRADSETLVETVLPWVSEGSEVLDLGTGSGNIGLALAIETGCHVTLVDVFESTLAIARKNALANNISVRSIRSNWFSRINDAFDVIVSNPPYVSSEDEHLHLGDLRFEPPQALIAGSDGLSALREIIFNATGYLKSQGLLAVEHGYDQADQVQQLFLKNDYHNVRTVKDYAGQPRVTLGQSA